MAARRPEELLGGYATGTLTDAERHTLFEAALADQALFEALADEQALKELLEDPVARRRLVAALEQASARTSAPGRWTLPDWLARPTTLRLTGTIVAALLLVVVVVGVYREGGLPVPGEQTPPQAGHEAMPGPATTLTDEQASSRQEADRKTDAPASPAPTPQRPEASRGRISRSDPPPSLLRQAEEAVAPKRSLPEATAPSASAPAARREAATAPVTWRVTASFGGSGAGRDPAPGEDPAESLGLSRGLRAPSARGVPSEPEGVEEKGARHGKKAADPAEALLRLRYRLVERDQKDGDRVVRTDDTLDPRRTIALRLSASEPGALYVIGTADRGRPSLLHAGPVEAETETRVTLDAWLSSIGEAGSGRVVILLTRHPLGTPAGDVATAALRRARRAPAAVVARVESPHQESDATAVAPRSGTPDAAVVVTLTFTRPS